MKTELWPLERLIDYARNPRKNDHAVDRVAAAIKEFGFRVPIIAKSDGLVVDGHLRLKAARKLGLVEVPVVLADDLTDAQVKAFRISVNRMAELAEWDNELLALELGELGELGFDLDLTGFGEGEIAALTPGGTEGLTDPDEVPEPPADPITKPGDLWLLGEHRVLCGDSTKAEDVARLMGGEKAQLIHADPPYGMGKEKDGVQNDNLYDDKLDAFQMAWWKAFRLHTDDNASAYIWGNAEELWRLWYVGGLKDSERLTMRNELAWAKGTAGCGGISHMGAEGLRQYPTETERCLFFMLGEQGFNNNADNYWDGFEPIRSYLETEMNKCGGAKNWKAALGNQMGGHYFTKSQWCFPTAEAYAKLQTFANGDAFKREHDELKREFYKTRAHFDNTHDNMTDVWEFPRVAGEDRHGHATPKPVAMICRAIKSSTAAEALVAEPFLGSGTTLIAAEQLGRKCYGMEISPAYVDVIVKRWEQFTGKQATRESARVT